MSKKILVAAAHTDDEVFGCGGTIARHAAEGDTVRVVYFTDGVGARSGTTDDIAARRAASDTACRILGVSQADHLDFPDNQLDSIPLLTIVQKFEEILSEYAPEIVYTHYAHDLNVDHRIVSQAVATACRPLPGRSVADIYCFEVVSSTEWGFGHFRPNVFVDISRFAETKTKALQAYSLELRAAPHARCYDNLEALARHRGCSVGVDLAEAFELFRSIR